MKESDLRSSVCLPWRGERGDTGEVVTRGAGEVLLYTAGSPGTAPSLSVCLQGRRWKGRRRGRGWLLW